MPVFHDIEIKLTPSGARWTLCACGWHSALRFGEAPTLQEAIAHLTEAANKGINDADRAR